MGFRTGCIAIETLFCVDRSMSLRLLDPSASVRASACPLSRLSIATCMFPSFVGPKYPLLDGRIHTVLHLLYLMRHISVLYTFGEPQTVQVSSPVDSTYIHSHVLRFLACYVSMCRVSGNKLRRFPGEIEGKRSRHDQNGLRSTSKTDLNRTRAGSHPAPTACAYALADCGPKRLGSLSQSGWTMISA